MQTINQLFINVVLQFALFIYVRTNINIILFCMQVKNQLFVMFFTLFTFCRFFRLVLCGLKKY
jgi:hypothetical protein